MYVCLNLCLYVKFTTISNPNGVKNLHSLSVYDRCNSDFSIENHFLCRNWNTCSLNKSVGIKLNTITDKRNYLEHIFIRYYLFHILSAESKTKHWRALYINAEFDTRVCVATLSELNYFLSLIEAFCFFLSKNPLVFITARNKNRKRKLGSGWAWLFPENASNWGRGFYWLYGTWHFKNKFIHFPSQLQFLLSPPLPVPSPTSSLLLPPNPLLLHVCSGKGRSPMRINKP